SMTQRAWVEAHVAALEFFGGTPQRLGPDNLKAGGCKPDLYDPKINRGDAELARHYGCLVDPARAYHPRDKATIEAGDPSYRTVKGILAAGTEHDGVQLPLPGTGVPAWLRGPGAFGGEQR